MRGRIKQEMSQRGKRDEERGIYQTDIKSSFGEKRQTKGRVRWRDGEGGEKRSMVEGRQGGEYGFHYEIIHYHVLVCPSCFLCPNYLFMLIHQCLNTSGSIKPLLSPFMFYI